MTAPILTFSSRNRIYLDQQYTILQRYGTPFGADLVLVHPINFATWLALGLPSEPVLRQQTCLTIAGYQILASYLSYRTHVTWTQLSQDFVVWGTDGVSLPMNDIEHAFSEVTLLAGKPPSYGFCLNIWQQIVQCFTGIDIR